MRRRNPTLARGFTLLEVLIALTILGLGVVTLLQIFSLGLRLGARSMLRTESAADGAQVMDELLARRILPAGSEGGTLGANGKWNAQVQALRDSPTSLGLSNNWELKEIDVELSSSDGGGRRAELKTLRLAKKANNP
jgi:prepilin-type N-terminal cleavage/methylation domain-containing protein